MIAPSRRNHFSPRSLRLCGEIFQALFLPAKMIMG